MKVTLLVPTLNELGGMKAQLEAADSVLVEQTSAACCYSRSDKYWVTDPSGIAWETFHTLGAVAVYGEDRAAAAQGSHCCVPLAAAANDDKAPCCVPSKADSDAKGACCQ